MNRGNRDCALLIQKNTTEFHREGPGLADVECGKDFFNQGRRKGRTKQTKGTLVGGE